jgi:hypothetical protein
MLGIDDDKPIIIEGEDALAMLEELKKVNGLNEENKKIGNKARVSTIETRKIKS